MIDDIKPDSKKLLMKIKEEERRFQKGKLKIFFGYAAGVGKTYSMLQEAHALKNNGIDIVVGYIEPHTRKETLELLDGLEILETRDIRYKGVTLKEFDLNRALERSPEVLLVDELPHTNPGSFRHKKRWQDIDELLDAGINVYTTLNVQHIESLNDIVASVTGIFVKETIPDIVINNADKIELIDIAADDLRKRFDEGKVYKEEVVDRAKNNFFTIDNLQALRELSLRRTADTVNSEAQIGRLSKNDINILPTKEKIMACISSAPSCAKVIRAAARMANSLKIEWIAVYVGSISSKSMTSDEKARLLEHIHLAEQLGAVVEIIHGEEVVDQLIKFAKYRNITKIVIGRNASRKRHCFNIYKRDIVDKLIEEVNFVEVNVIPAIIDPSDNNKVKNINMKRSLIELLRFSKRDFVIAGIITIVITIVAIIIFEFKFAEANILLVFILGVLLVSISTKGYGLGILAAFINVFTFNIFFTEPRLTLFLYDPTYIVTFPFFILVATITSTLTTRVKEQSDMFSKREETAQMLYEISRSFINLSGAENIINTGIEHIVRGIKKGIIFYKVNDGSLDGDYVIRKVTEDEVLITENIEKDIEIAYWSLNNKKNAGKGTDTHNGVSKYYIPIVTTNKAFGVLGINCGAEELDKDDMSFINAVVGQIFLALDRETLVKEREISRLEIDRERLRSNLLRAISHDLRTPLTGIAGSSNLILKSYDELDENSKLELIRGINSDSEWLIRLVGNLLNMTRMENGNLKVEKKSELIEEVISSAIEHLRSRIGKHDLTLKLPDEIFFVNMDGKLIEQVIINLVDNAIKYTQFDSNINIEVYRKNENVFFEISDNGPGIDKEDIIHIFDIFYKGGIEESDSKRGVGLGLSICKSIIVAHSGEIEVKNNIPSGAKFIFYIPIE